MGKRNFVNTTIVIICISVLFVCCEDDKKVEAEMAYKSDSLANIQREMNDHSIWGHWVCTDFIELVKMRRSVRAVNTRPIFLELYFDNSKPDSVRLESMYGNLTAYFVKEGSILRIKGVLPTRDILLQHNDTLGSLVLNDNTFSGSKTQQTWLFTKVPSSLPQKDGSVIYNLVNESLLQGRYTLVHDNYLDTIQFSSNGSLLGWRGYNSYSICAGGDCYKISDTPYDILILTDGRGPEYYGLEIRRNDSVYLHRLERGGTDDEYAYIETGKPLGMQRLP